MADRSRRRRCHALLDGLEYENRRRDHVVAAAETIITRRLVAFPPASCARDAGVGNLAGVHFHASHQQQKNRDNPYEPGAQHTYCSAGGLATRYTMSIGFSGSCITR
jgi:hypothetical protein